MKRFVFILALVILCLATLQIGSTPSSRVNAQTAGEPELPRVLLSTQYPVLNGAVFNVSAGGDLQAAINSAQLGDTIVLQAGAQFTGNFTLPAKSGSGWIIIRTSNLAGISVEGTRVTPSQASAMSRVLTPNSAPAFATNASAHHFRFVGLEIGIAQGVATNYGIVALGNTSSQTTTAAAPHDLVFDRCYIHGNSTGDVSRGVALNSASTAIIDSTISNIHGVGFDTQAIAGWNGPGPFKIVNNYLEAAGENFMFGGADPKIANMVPSDIEFRRNNCFKPLSWNPADPTYAGVHWSVKNLFELKNAQRVLVDGNIFENCWVDGQTGFAIVFTPRNQEGTAPWSVVRDVTFTNNIVRHSAAGVQFLGHDNNFPSQQEQRIKVKNNLFYDIGGSVWGANGRLFQIIDATADVHIDHNTAIQTSNIITADGAPSTGFVYTNNIAPHNSYGVIGSGRGVGNDSLIYYFPACQFAKNLLMSGPANAYPAGNFFSTMSQVGFVDVASANYRLSNTSQYKHAGTDGLDIGTDQDAIEAAIGGQQNPPPPAPNQPPTVSINCPSTSGNTPFTTSFTAMASDPDGSIAGYSWNFGDGSTATQSNVTHTFQTAGTFNVVVTVSDNLGATASAAVLVTVTPSVSTNIVLYASEAPVRVGHWNVASDPSAAGGACLRNPDAGVAKIVTPVPQPADYFEMSFYAIAGRGYRLWMRGKAQNDSPYNDSVFVQFSNSVDSAGAPAFRIGTTDATTINLEDCLSCGIQGWGWQDNGWGVGVLGPLVYFASGGQQTLRVQVREDGLSIDQIVLSPQTYLTNSPGQLKNDTTILSRSSGIAAPQIGGITPNIGSTAGGAVVVISGDGFFPGASVKFGGMLASSIQVNGTSIQCVVPAHSSATVDIEVANPDGQSTTATGAYSYVASSQPSVTLRSPNGGESFPYKAICTIGWVFDGDAKFQELYWSPDDGATWTLIAQFETAESSYDWMIPKIRTDTGRVKVRVLDRSGIVVEDTSDGMFSIRKR
jgi:hypothetical protein